MAKSIYPAFPLPATICRASQATLGAMRQTMNMMILNAQNPNPNFAPSSAAQVFVTHDQLQSLGVVNKSPRRAMYNRVGSAGTAGVEGPKDRGPAGSPGATGPAGPGSRPPLRCR